MNVGRYLRGEDLHVGTSRITKPKELKMNEQIRELVRRAGLDDANFPIKNWDNVPLEKFAELIVQECARTAAYFSIENKRIHPDIDPREMPDANRMVYHATCQSVAEEIKEHFGVEE